MFVIAKIYAYVYFILKENFNIRIPGLGYILRKIQAPRVLDLKGMKLYFNPEVGGEYGTHIIGRWQEPETHGFIRSLFSDRIYERGLFIDVGSNIGIFLLDVARLSNYKVVGFEPSKICSQVTIDSMTLNGNDNFEVHNLLVGSTSGNMRFSFDKGIEGASVFNSITENKGEFIPMITLDSMSSLVNYDENKYLMLIDVEGYELEVLKGARELVRKKMPLIIFEFNNVSRRHFTLDEIRNELGSDYCIYNLRKDSLLDCNFLKTWNCVAVNSKSCWYKVCNDLMIK